MRFWTLLQAPHMLQAVLAAPLLKPHLCSSRWPFCHVRLFNIDHACSDGSQVVDPPILLRLVAAAAEDHSSDEGVHLWQPIIKEGSFSNLGWRLNEEAAQSP